MCVRSFGSYLRLGFLGGKIKTKGLVWKLEDFCPDSEGGEGRCLDIESLMTCLRFLILVFRLSTVPGIFSSGHYPLECFCIRLFSLLLTQQAQLPLSTWSRDGCTGREVRTGSESETPLRRQRCSKLETLDLVDWIKWGPLWPRVPTLHRTETRVSLNRSFDLYYPNWCPVHHPSHRPAPDLLDQKLKTRERSEYLRQ